MSKSCPFFQKKIIAVEDLFEREESSNVNYSTRKFCCEKKILN